MFELFKYCSVCPYIISFCFSISLFTASKLNSLYRFVAADITGLAKVFSKLLILSEFFFVILIIEGFAFGCNFLNLSVIILSMTSIAAFLCEVITTDFLFWLAQ